MESPRSQAGRQEGPLGSGSGRAPTPPGGSDPCPQHAGRLNLLLSYAGWQAESWADRVPRLLEPLGIRALRAASAREASQVIRVYPVHIAVVDLGLPLDEAAAGAGQEAGPRVLELLSRLQEPPPTVVVKQSRTHRDESREIAAALRAGAFAVIDRPMCSRDVETFLEVLRRCLLRYYRGQWPGIG